MGQFSRDNASQYSGLPAERYFIDTCPIILVAHVLFCCEPEIILIYGNQLSSVKTLVRFRARGVEARRGFSTCHVAVLPALNQGKRRVRIGPIRILTHLFYLTLGYLRTVLIVGFCIPP